MNTMSNKLKRYLSRYEFAFSDKRIKVTEPRYIDIQDGVTTIIRDFNGFSLFAYQGIVFIVYFNVKNDDKNASLDCAWEICIVNSDKSIKKVREAKKFKFVERHIEKYVRSEADAIF